MILPDSFALVRPPQHTVQYAYGSPLSRALSGRPFCRFATIWCEKGGLERLPDSPPEASPTLCPLVLVEDSLDFVKVRGFGQGQLEENSCLMGDQVVPLDEPIL